METETAVNPPTTENEQVKCSYCGDAMMMRNLATHTGRKHGSKPICWTIRNLKVKKLNSYFQPEPKTNPKEKPREKPKEKPDRENVTKL